MASVDSTGLIVSGRLRSGDLLHAGLAVALLLGVWSVGGLEVSTGKLCEGKIPDDKKEPSANVSHKRLEFVGSSKNKNISILLWNITFEDDGKYICFARNPKENNRNHSATFTLKVVDQSLNGSTVLLPCTYSSCIGIKNLYVSWRYNDNGTILKLCEAVIPIEGEEPMVFVYQERVEFVGSSKSNDISMLLWNITFEDEGEYICFARNPKEKGRDHSATFTLKVVDQYALTLQMGTANEFAFSQADQKRLHYTPDQSGGIGRP
ncbi:sodium channel%2C voltage-gated, type IV, beta a isoform X1 [Scomber scombrus]|uniref:Sodium channel, voltage-gated, type IV, beta a isoform X1 n=1 Tax=Scomber scombrus TaxID=13677 RepID=A0AAV1P2C8_SCOSC